MARQQKTLEIIDNLLEILPELQPVTVRQAYYQLVGRQVIENKRSQYQRISTLLVDLRRDGTIPWEWIEDRLRLPREVPMWGGVDDFARDAAGAYRRDVWESQPSYFEFWCEKDALSGIFLDVLRSYGITLNIGRGYDGWDSIHNAAERLGSGQGVTILYYGDFDPSGEDIARSLAERLADQGCKPEFIKSALTYQDVIDYSLPFDFTKAKDSRRAAFVAKYGDMAVELDALPADVLRTRLTNDIRSRMDLDALAKVREAERVERDKIRAALGGI